VKVRDRRQGRMRREAMAGCEQPVTTWL
jgi:hypothetical protein